MSTGRVRCAILGAGGYIGQQFVRLLADHPRFALEELVSGDRSAGRRLGELWRVDADPPRDWASERLRPRTPRQLAEDGIALVFSALPSGRAGDVEDAFMRRGLSVFTNAADHRSGPTARLLVPEVNGLALRSARASPATIVANPNCTATGLALALAPIVPLLHPRTISVSSYQALSGAGLAGIDQLGRPPNVVPFIPGEEEKVRRETLRLLGTAVRGLDIQASCVRVPVRDGHLETVTLESRRHPSADALIQAWRGFDPLAGVDCPTAPHPPIVYRSEQDRPQPLLDLWAGSPPRARGMAVSVGRLRVEGRRVRFVLLLHNAVRGGAGGSVLNAEFLYALRESRS
ncbi:MAG TPA: aspartate-semialdehyde dehydrogenase [Thermoplasmata archaeon]|nr:aspartate-semialdehyde dehydrogenase [Thermoplasmata archaeon]